MNNVTDFIEFDPAWSHIDAICPHCDREERFEDELTARAWMTGHIQEVHANELPTYENTDRSEEQ